MRSLAPVVWTEGMHLAQHHFQAQSRYFEELVDFALSTLHPAPYGFGEVELDTDALLNGTAALRGAWGVMPDGLAFDFAQDDPPEPVTLEGRFPSTQESLDLLLAIPADGAGEGRYSSRSVERTDETTGREKLKVELARKNFRIVLREEDLRGAVTMPLARVRRGSQGELALDPAFVPPLLRIGASRRLVGTLERIRELLVGKAESLREERAGVPSPEFSSREVASFWFAHAVHTGLVPLLHHLRTEAAHPETVYLELARLAGALCTFALNLHPKDLPAYDHQAPGPCFDQLERHLREQLGLVLSTSHLRIPLRRADEAHLMSVSRASPDQLHRLREFVSLSGHWFFTGEVKDARALARAQWFLGVRSSRGAAETVSSVPRVVKVCSAAHIVRLVQDAYPGLPLEHVPTPPSAIGPRFDTQYFGIRLQPGGCWSSIMETREVGVYVPGSIPDAEVELSVLLDG